MTALDATGMERVPFDGRSLSPLHPSRYRRHAHEGHGPRCSSNPTIGCVCGEAERASERDERLRAPDQSVPDPNDVAPPLSWDPTDAGWAPTQVGAS